MSEAAVLFRKFQFEHAFVDPNDGTTTTLSWELDRPNLNTEAGYARHLRKRVIEGLKADRDLLGDYEYSVAWKEWSNVYATGKYNWMSPMFFESLADPINCQALLHIWFGQCYNHKLKSDDDHILSESDIHEMWKTNKAGFNQLLGEMLNDPNPSTPQG